MLSSSAIFSIIVNISIIAIIIIIDTNTIIISILLSIITFFLYQVANEIKAQGDWEN